MSYKDYTYTKARPGVISTDALFSLLIKETCKRIYDLGVFALVGPRIRAREISRWPACVVSPLTREVAEQGLSTARFDYRYNVQVAFVLKHPNDTILLQQVLYLEQLIRTEFAKLVDGSPLVFSSVSGHYNTIVESAPIEPMQDLGNNVLSYNSGIKLVYSVWKTES